jgi:hypothetical protein
LEKDLKEGLFLEDFVCDIFTHFISRLSEFVKGVPWDYIKDIIIKDISMKQSTAQINIP